MVSFPTSLDAFTNPTSVDDLDTASVYHDIQHGNANDAIEALEAKVGVDGSTVYTSMDYKLRSLGDPPTSGGNDDDFGNESFTGWTTVNSGSHTVVATESRGRLSLAHPGSDAAGELHAYMKNITPSTNDWIEICLSGFGQGQNYNIAGLVMGDGATYGAGSQVFFYHSPNENNFSRSDHSGYNSAANVNGWGYQTQVVIGKVYMRLKYSGSNAFVAMVSPDGLSWITAHSWTRTLSPTWMGFAITTWGGAQPFIWTLDYARFGNG